ncbi:MAG: hypothetical protein LHV68_04405 [Elusimicrobia bacterium]|nr:hypothetical protein [Candidatus Liberimonas magnetica]
MKKVGVFALVMIMGANFAYAANPFDNFQSLITGQATTIAQGMLDNFAKDLGALMGGGTYHQGKSLGLPGFDVGLRIPVVKVKDEDTIIKSSLDSVALPILQAEIGLPANLDLIARFTSYSDSSLAGVGLRYGIIKKSIPGVPSLSAQAVYNTLNVNSGLNKLKATTLSVSCIASIDLPIVVPYAGIGIDNTEVTPDATIIDLKGKASSMRVEAGVNLSLIPLTYIQLGGALVNGDINYTLGLGIKF